MCIYAQDNRINIRTKNETFATKYRLYELEEKLPENFVRISKSTIVNIDYVKSMEMEFNGKMILYLENGDHEYTSRNYLNDIKSALGIGGKKYEKE